MILDGYVLTVDIAGFAKTFIESGRIARIGMRRLAANDPDHGKRRLLRTPPERPRYGGATDKCNEFPSPHGFARAQDYIGYQRKSHYLNEKFAVRCNQQS